ncbi:MAG: hypothetical protein J7M03_02715 [Candidatus Desulfofervidaceae bacterium]|nr:hypothetical protein [Candidatus Desulfofervidaceae bacterium]
MREANLRIESSTDPLTGEEWDGDKQLFNLQYRTALRMIENDDDPVPKQLAQNGTGSSSIDQIKYIINTMLTGEISPATATDIIQPLMVLIDLTELQEVRAMLIKANLNLNLNDKG